MEPDVQSDNTDVKPIDYWGVFKAIWSNRKSIIKIVSIITLLTVGISLLLSNKYRSTAVVLPDNEASKLGGLGGLADLASMAGVSVGGGKSWVELYPQIIVSDAVLKNIIYKKFQSVEFKDSVNLIEYFEFDYPEPLKNYDKTFQTLTKLIEVSADKKTRVVSVSLVLYESKLAAEIINAILKEMDEFIRTKRISNASERRKWIEQRLADVKIDLARSENALKDFRERNRVVSGSPQLLLEQQRLIREVEINSTVFIELKKQLELAKIDEINTMPIINILDAARQTTIKESPKRSIIVISFFLLSCMLSAGYYAADHLYREQIRDFRRRLREMLSV
jgi:uncharacterized protein involved in exopolysaccharide biosynthesis